MMPKISLPDEISGFRRTSLTLNVSPEVFLAMRADITVNGQPCEVELLIGGMAYPVRALSLQAEIYGND